MAEWKAREIPGAVFALLCFIGSSLAMLIWPFAVLADIMGLAGYRSGKESMLLLVVSRSFMFGTLVYPLVYIPCFLALRRLAAARDKDRLILLTSVIPIVYLMVLGGLAWAWVKCEVPIR